jgi:excisionase family DNA binding protein
MDNTKRAGPEPVFGFIGHPHPTGKKNGMLPGKSPKTGALLMGMGAGAEFLGVSRTTLWRLIREGQLQKVEVLPGSYRVRREDLEAIASANGRGN